MAARRSNGEGTLRKRPDGLWECTIMTGFQKNGKRQYKSFYGKTQRETKNKVKEYRDLEKAGLNMNVAPTFGEWAQKWYDGYAGQVSPTTYESYRYTLRLLKEVFGEKLLRQIKVSDVEEFLKDMTKDGTRFSQATKCRGMLYQIMHKAQANDLILKNPVAFADKIKQRRTKSSKDSFTAEEVRTLFRELPDDKLGNSIRLLLLTGMRVQEMLPLEKEYIAEDGSCIYVRQAVKLVKGNVSIGGPKSECGTRNIPIPQAYHGLVRKLREDCDPYLWTAKDGAKPFDPSHFRRNFKALLETIDGVRVFPPHCCRHTYVSQMQAAGVSIETIQSIVGHAEIDMTEHYLHVQAEVKKDAAEKLTQILSA